MSFSLLSRHLHRSVSQCWQRVPAAAGKDKLTLIIVVCFIVVMFYVITGAIGQNDLSLSKI